MSETFFAPERRFFAPEVIQTSAMDCGPAALKCLLEGFGIPVSYGRLREACQTSVDGTSIDTLEDVARQLGLQATQIIAPPDHLLLQEANLLPALVVTRLPDGLPHFMIVWRVVGAWVQIMDPATGRRWLPRRRLLQDLYRHTLSFPAAEWRAWAGGPGFVEPLRCRLQNLQLAPALLTTLLTAALADTHWYALAALDAAVRFLETLAQAGGVQRGEEAAQLLTDLLAPPDPASPSASTGAAMVIPAHFWFVQLLLPTRAQGSDAPPQLLLRGAVLIQVQGRRPPVPARIGADHTTDDIASDAARLAALVAALAEPPYHPEWEIWRALRADGLLTPTLVSLAAMLAAATVTLEALLLRGLLQLTTAPLSQGQHTVLLGLALFTLLLGLVELPSSQIVLRMGRRLETRLRIALLKKLPTLGDQYFRSRLISDMATRAHGLHRLHALPDLALQSVRLSVQLFLTAGGVIWLYPASAPLTLLSTGFALGAALLTQPFLSELDLRVRTHTGALSRFYLDALLGLTPIRTHSAARAVRREHESRLVAWARAHLTFHDLQRVIQSAVTLAGTAFAIAIVLRYLAGGGEASGVLLLLYWVLNLPALGQSLLRSVQQYPVQRNHVLRLLEPLSAPGEEAEPRQNNDALDGRIEKQRNLAIPRIAQSDHTGVALHFQDVTVIAGGHTLLSAINVTIAAGEHVAIVGPSGAGKSTLVGLLLGWQRPAAGQVLAAGQPLTGDHLHALRRITAWVDPAVQLWNRSLIANLTYGAHPRDITAAVEGAALYDVLEKLPEGLQTDLGESGGLVSGGQGQQVRLGRALARPDVRLVILDEPFRGLDHTKRNHLLRNARQHWQAATLLCITHDVSATQDFARVLVVEDGRIVEDGAPTTLAAQPHSRYRALVDADEAVHRTLWTGSTWRRFWLAEGNLHEQME